MLGVGKGTEKLRCACLCGTVLTGDALRRAIRSPNGRAFVDHQHYARYKSSLRPAGELGNALWRIISNRGITPTEMARVAGVSQGTIANLVRGGRPSARVLAALIAAFAAEVPAVETEEDHRARVAAARWSDQATSQLAGFLRDEMLREQITAAELGRRLGVPHGVLTSWLRGAMPTETNLAKLRMAYGSRLPLVTSDTERRRNQARANHQVAVAALQTQEARARNAAARRGRPNPALSATMRAKAAAAKASGRTYGPGHGAKPPRWRAMIALGHLMRSNTRPSRSVLEVRAADVGGRLGVSADTVLGWWRPSLQAAGLKRMGRPPKKERCWLIRRLLQEYAPTGRVGWGQWAQIRRQVNAAEDRPAKGPEVDAEEWWKEHKRACTCPPAPSEHAAP